MDKDDGYCASQTVLVVDDEQVNREVLKSLLEDDGYKVVIAENGRDGLSKSTSEIDAILLDVMMPQMDGLTTCRRLSADASTRDIPVLFLSGLSKEQFLQAACKAGAYDFLRKPVRASELRTKLAAATKLDPHDSLQQRRDRYQELVRRAAVKEAAEEAAVNSLLDQACLSGM